MVNSAFEVVCTGCLAATAAVAAATSAAVACSVLFGGHCGEHCSHPVAVAAAAVDRGVIP